MEWLARNCEWVTLRTCGAATLYMRRASLRVGGSIRLALGRGRRIPANGDACSLPVSTLQENTVRSRRARCVAVVSMTP